MQNWRESYDKVFEEIKNLLSELSKSDTYEDILMKENEINQLYQKFSFLKVSQNFEFSSTEIEPLQIIENQLNKKDPILGFYDYYQLGIIYFEQKNYQKALECFNKTNPNYEFAENIFYKSKVCIFICCTQYWVFFVCIN